MKIYCQLCGGRTASAAGIAYWTDTSQRTHEGVRTRCAECASESVLLPLATTMEHMAARREHEAQAAHGTGRHCFPEEAA